MSWYATSNDEGQEFSFMDESTRMESPELFHSRHTLESLESLCIETGGALGVESGLVKYGYDYEKIQFPGPQFLFVVTVKEGKFVVPGGRDPWPSEVDDWIWSLTSLDLYDYFPDIEEDFWENVGPGARLYHGTYDERIESIKENGLEPKEESRGIDNRATGPGIFMSQSAEEAEYSYPIVIEIDVGRMKQDGYMPPMEGEEPVVEARMREAMAWRLGLTDFRVEVESGIYESTVICRGKIPPKYLTVLE